MDLRDIIIRDAGSCISIIRNGVPLLVAKRHIKTVDTIALDAVRLNIGEGPLRDIYIRPLEVAEPDIKNVFDLQEYFGFLLGPLVS